MSQMLLRIDGTRHKTPSILEAKIKGIIDHQRIDGVRIKSASKKQKEKVRIKDIVGMEDIGRSLPFTVD